MKRFNFRVAAVTLFTTLTLNALVAWGVGHYSENFAFGILAWVIGWGVDLPGMLLLLLCAYLGGNLLWQADATTSDLMILAAISLFSGLTWSLLLGRILKNKTADSVDT